MTVSPARGPSSALPLAYFVVATAAFTLAALAKPWLAPELAGHYYQPRVLALAHTLTLGWITLTIMGASYQLLPVVLERPLRSEGLAWAQLALMVVGVSGMIAHFWLASWPGLVWAAGVVGAGVAVHLINIALTVRGMRQWTFTARLVAMALGGLGLTTLAGVALGLDKICHVLPADLFANMHAHLHLGLLGWVLPMVIGVAARVYPMFLLAREPGGWPGRVQLGGLAFGVPAVVMGILASPALLGAGAVALTAAVLAHLVWVAGMVHTRKRPTLDRGLRLALLGTVALMPAAALGLALAFELIGGPRAAMAYMALALGAWASLTIAGMLLKIVPFLVWYRAYAGRVGRERVPTLAELSWPAGERVAGVLLTVGLYALAIALWLGDASAIRLAGAVVAGGALAFGATLTRVLAHLRSGRCAAVTSTPAAKSA